MSDLPITSRSNMPAGDCYHVYQITYGRQAERRSGQNFLWPVKDMLMPLEYPMWLLVNADRVIVVDTGMKRRHFGGMGTTGHHKGVMRTWLVDPLEALQRLGIPAESVENVIFTHLHGDHAGFVRAFSKAKFYLQADELAFATGPAVLGEAIGGAYNADDMGEVIEALYSRRLVFCKERRTIFPGVDVVRAPGHSVGLQVVRVNTQRGPIVLASDATHYFANIVLENPFPICTGNLDEILPTGKRVMELAGGLEFLVPGHDGLVARNYPGVEMNGVPMTILHEPPVPIQVDEIRRSLGLD